MKKIKSWRKNKKNWIKMKKCKKVEQNKIEWRYKAFVWIETKNKK